MAEKTEPKKDKPAESKPAEGEAGHKKKGGLLTKMPVLIGGIMLLEAVALIGAVKVMGIGAAKSAAADVTLKEAKEGEDPHAEGEHGTEEGKKEESHGETKPEAGHGGAAGDKGAPALAAAPKPVGGVNEIEVTKFRAPNVQTGRRFIYEIEIVAIVKASNYNKVKTVLEGRKATIEDRIRTIIAQSDPDKLSAASEPGLETLRRQVKHEIEQISGEGTLQEIVIPRCIPFRGE